MDGYFSKHSGKCCICGESTDLLIHQECGDKAAKKFGKKKKAKKKVRYEESFIRYLEGR
jgi:hypothetical protein